jgi:hypothetical protein
MISCSRFFLRIAAICLGCGATAFVLYQHNSHQWTPEESFTFAGKEDNSDDLVTDDRLRPETASTESNEKAARRLALDRNRVQLQPETLPTKNNESAHRLDSELAGEKFQIETVRTKNSGGVDRSDSDLTGIQLHPEIVLTEDNYDRIWPMKMTNLDYKFLRSPKNPCTGKYVKLLVMSFTRVLAYNKRQTIRSTWGSVAATGQRKGKNYPGVSLYFLLGVPDPPTAKLMAEMEEHDDIILANFVDAYRNLTLKSLLALKWAKEFCPEAEFVAKVDEDVFFDVPILWPILNGHNAENLLGRINHANKVERTSGKWTVPLAHFPLESYPDYLRGGAYILGKTAIPRLLFAAEYVPPFSIEDVFITGVLTRLLNITIVNHKCFIFNHWTTLPKNSPNQYCAVMVKNIAVLNTAWAAA